MLQTLSSRLTVAKVCRNLCRNQLPQNAPSAQQLPCRDAHVPQLRPARFAIFFSLLSKFLSGHPASVGKTRLWGLGVVCRSLQSFSASSREAGTGRSPAWFDHEDALSNPPQDRIIRNGRQVWFGALVGTYLLGVVGKSLQTLNCARQGRKCGRLQILFLAVLAFWTLLQVLQVAAAA